MAKPNPAAPVSPAPDPAALVDARVRTLHGDVRHRAGLALPATGWVDVAVTRAQLAELEADAQLDVRYAGKPAAGPAPEPDGVLSRATHEQALARVRDEVEADRARLGDQLAEARRNHAAALAALRDADARTLRDAVGAAITAMQARGAEPQRVFDDVMARAAAGRLAPPATDDGAAGRA